MPTSRTVRGALAIIVTAAALTALLPAPPATANPVGSVTIVDQFHQPINTWLNVTFNIAGNPPAWNCWQQVKFGNNAGSAYVQIRYIAGYCSDNTGLAVVELRHPSEQIVRTPALGVCTTWNGAGCVQLYDGSWFLQVGGSSSVIRGDFRLCQNNAYGTDSCVEYHITWA